MTRPPDAGQLLNPDEGRMWFEHGHEHGCPGVFVWVCEVPFVGEGDRFRGLVLEIAYAMTPGEAPPDAAWLAPPFSMNLVLPLLPGWYRDHITRAIVYVNGHPSGPRLELLRRPGQPDRIALHGLEGATLGNAGRLLRALPALRRMVAGGGRPPGPASLSWREAVAEGDRLRMHGLTWEQIAGRLGVSVRTLQNWRKRAR